MKRTTYGIGLLIITLLLTGCGWQKQEQTYDEQEHVVEIARAPRTESAEIAKEESESEKQDADRMKTDQSEAELPEIDQMEADQPEAEQPEKDQKKTDPSKTDQAETQREKSGKTNRISREQAIALVLKRVPGASEKQVEIELDFDDGYWKYEGDIDYNGVEYEFELNAETGELLEWKEEPED